jgi:hypothetical protein
MLDSAIWILWVVVIVGILLIGGFAIYVWANGAVAGETADQRQARLNAVFELLKFLLGTVAVTVLATALAQSLKDREQILKEREQVAKETEEFGKLLTYALALDGQTRVHFADFFAHVTRDKDYRDQWGQYRDDIKADIIKEANIKSETSVLLARVDAGNLSPEEQSKVTVELKEKANELRATQIALAPLISPSPALMQRQPSSMGHATPIKLSELGSVEEDGSIDVPALFAKKFAGAGAEERIYEFLKQQLESSGYHLHTSTNYVDPVGVRKPLLNDLYDDEIFAAWTDENGKKHAEGLRATCDPGVAPEIYRGGHAQLLDGQYDFRRAPREKGSGKGDVVLAQSGPVVISRWHADGTYGGDEQGDFGILIKPGGTEANVGINGYGSQAIFGGRDGALWKRFFEIITKVTPAEQKTFRYTLLSIVEE